MDKSFFSKGAHCSIACQPESEFMDKYFFFKGAHSLKYRLKPCVQHGPMCVGAAMHDAMTMRSYRLTSAPTAMQTRACWARIVRAVG